MNRGTGPGEFASEDPNFDLALCRLLTGETTAEPEAASSFGEVLPPAVAILRARDMTEPIIGKRCRYLLTDHDEQGNIVDYGWRSDLRVVSGKEEVAGAVEPCYWVQEEANYYRALSGGRNAPRHAVGASRVWVEMYVDQPVTGGRAESAPSARGTSANLGSVPEGPNAWLARVVEDPNRPRIAKPIPARDAHSLIGRRAIIVDTSGHETDLRVADEPTFAHGGDIGVTVIGEGAWYRWHEPQAGHASLLRTYPVEQVWIEA